MTLPHTSASPVAARLRHGGGTLPLRTDRLVLRPPNPADAPTVTALAGARQIARFTSSIPHPLTTNDVREWIHCADGHHTTGTGLILLITGRADAAIVGAIDLRWEQTWPAAEVGYWVGVPYQGQGYATEALAAVIRLAFGPLALEEVFASACPDNAASLAVLTKAGLRPDGTVIEVPAPARGTVWFHDRRSLRATDDQAATQPRRVEDPSPANISSVPKAAMPTPQAAPDTSPSTAALIVIGNEILSGRTQDVNAQYLAKRLGGIGVPLREIRVVPDDTDVIVAAVNALRAQETYVFTTGGIGPTHDDITADAIAKAFKVPLIRHPEAVAILTAHYGDALTESRLKMAETPAGAALIDNPISAAPGFRMENVHVLAGVPKIMQAMVESVLPTLAGGPPLLSRAVCAPAREGDIAAPLAAIQARWPEVSLGSYPWAQGGQLGTTLVARGTDADAVTAVADEVATMLRGLGLTPEFAERPTQQAPTQQAPTQQAPTQQAPEPDPE